MELPADFIQQTREIMGEELFGRYLASFDGEVPVSIRLNPRKCHLVDDLSADSASRWMADEAGGAAPVPWCEYGFYLPTRPNFTFDPLLHAGLYYVQEASSMFLGHVLRELSHTGWTLGEGAYALDLCAAPGGKSTLLRSMLPEDCTLISNEPMRNRAEVLAENVQKWGYARHLVTNNYPKDFRKSGLQFQLILCDVPCSGEGMFRKDEATIGEWSFQNVNRCWQLQREIVSEAWQCLCGGGVLIYSTCTFNTKENEENIRWMIEELGAEVISVRTEQSWSITGSLLSGFQEPVYRFIPGVTKGEGLFMCILRKGGDSSVRGGRNKQGINTSNYHERATRNSRERSSRNQLSLRILSDGEYPVGMSKGKTVVPAHAEAIYIDRDTAKYPTAELTYQQAVSYLRRESIVLDYDVPHGFVVVTFEGVPLGFVKNIGSRANNHYPESWKIKTTHIPQDYEAILRHT